MNLVKQTWRVGGETYADPFNLADGALPDSTGIPIERSPIAEIAPFIETMGPVGHPPRRREFWWEREWRHRGDLSFSITDVVAAFAPAHRHGDIRAELDRLGVAEPRLLDPRWGLERMIAALADVPGDFAGPLPGY